MPRKARPIDRPQKNLKPLRRPAASKVIRLPASHLANLELVRQQIDAYYTLQNMPDYLRHKDDASLIGLALYEMLRTLTPAKS